jgi:PAS domain S-box-containing protein
VEEKIFMSEKMWIEDLLQFAIDDRTDWIFVKDAEHRYLRVNSEFAAMLNLRPQDLIGKPDTDFWPEDMCLGNSEKGWRGFHQDESIALSGEAISHERDCIMLPDGSEHFFDTFYTPLRDENGKVYAVLGRWWRVTNPKEIINALRESEFRLRTLIDASPNLIVFEDSDGRWLSVNQAALQTFELANKPWQGKTVREIAALLTPSLQEILLRCMEAGEQAWLSGQASITEEFLAQPNGTRKVMHISMKPLFEKDGRRKALVMLGREVTTYLNAQARLREEQALLTGALQGVNVATFVIDAEHTVRAWNAAMEELTGVKAADIVGTKEVWRGFYPAARPCLANLIVSYRHDEVPNYYGSSSKAEYAGDTFRAEGWFQLRGRRRYLNFEATPILDGAGKRIAAVQTQHDITEQMQDQTRNQTVLETKTEFKAKAGKS